jgi:hypothetical protein
LSSGRKRRKIVKLGYNLKIKPEVKTIPIEKLSKKLSKSNAKDDLLDLQAGLQISLEV